MKPTPGKDPSERVRLAISCNPITRSCDIIAFALSASLHLVNGANISSEIDSPPVSALLFCRCLILGGGISSAVLSGLIVFVVEFVFASSVCNVLMNSKVESWCDNSFPAIFAHNPPLVLISKRPDSHPYPILKMGRLRSTYKGHSLRRTSHPAMPNPAD